MTPATEQQDQGRTPTAPPGRERPQLSRIWYFQKSGIFGHFRACTDERYPHSSSSVPACLRPCVPPSLCSSILHPSFSPLYPPCCARGAPKAQRAERFSVHTSVRGVPRYGRPAHVVRARAPRAVSSEIHPSSFPPYAPALRPRCAESAARDGTKVDQNISRESKGLQS